MQVVGVGGNGTLVPHHIGLLAIHRGGGPAALDRVGAGAGGAHRQHHQVAAGETGHVLVAEAQGGGQAVVPLVAVAGLHRIALAVAEAPADLDPGFLLGGHLGDDIDHAAHGVAAVEGRGGAGHHLDLLHLAHGNAHQAGQTAGVAVGETHAVHHHLHPAVGEAAEGDDGGGVDAGAGAQAVAHVEAGHLGGEGVADAHGARGVQLVGRHDGDGCRGLQGGLLDARGGHHHAAQFRLALLSGGQGGLGKEGGDGGGQEAPRLLVVDAPHVAV